MITLGIETSCDETALALIETREVAGIFECRIIQSLVHSQAELHSAYGGVFPSLAKREHGKNIVPLLHKLFTDSGLSYSKINDDDFNSTIESFKTDLEPSNPDLFESLKGASFLKDVPKIDRIAVTEGPGLEPALWVGISFARFISALWNITVIPVNHMEGHIYGSLLESDTPYGAWQKLKPVTFPALALLISGGHTELVKIGRKDNPRNVSLSGLQYTIIGKTKDDAVGEAFDKVARLLGLPYPGGPHISMLSRQAAEQNIKSPIKLPRPMIGSGDMDFSFSGLKTAVLYAVRAQGRALTDDFKKGLAQEFEQSVSETLDFKLRKSIEYVDAKTLIIGGGVSANTMLRKGFQKTADEFDMPLYLPSTHVSGDNALMIALAGSFHANDSIRDLEADGTKQLD